MNKIPLLTLTPAHPPPYPPPPPEADDPETCLYLLLSLSLYLLRSLWCCVAVYRTRCGCGPLCARDDGNLSVSVYTPDRVEVCAVRSRTAQDQETGEEHARTCVFD